MTYKVYVAGKWEERGNIAPLLEELRNGGFEITHDWTVEDDDGMSGQALKDYWADCARKDYHGVLDAHALVLINHPKCRGAHTELGIACATGARIIVVGRDEGENIFFNLPWVQHVNTFREAKMALSRLRSDRDSGVSE